VALITGGDSGIDRAMNKMLFEPLIAAKTGIPALTRRA